MKNITFTSLSFVLLFMFSGFTSEVEAQITIHNETDCWIYFGAREGINCNTCGSIEMWIAPNSTLNQLPASGNCPTVVQNWEHVRYGVAGFFPTFNFTSFGISFNPNSVPGPCGSDLNGNCGGNFITHQWSTDPVTGESKFGFFN